MSPTAKNSAGLRCIPTPLGVPVKITSPGFNVMHLKFKIKTSTRALVSVELLYSFRLLNHYFDNKWIMSSILKINSFVFPDCFSIPLMLQFTFKLCGSGTWLLWTIQGPSGQKVSIDFPIKNWPPLLFKINKQNENSRFFMVFSRLKSHINIPKLLPVSRADILGNAVTKHIIESIRFANVSSFFSNDDCKLNLPIKLL